MFRKRRKRLQNRARARVRTLEQLEARLPLTVEVEPNDSLATATLLPANQLVEGEVLHVQDVDHFRVVLQQGDQFRLQTANTQDARFSPTLPPSVDLLDSTGRLLTTTSDGRDLYFTAPSTGDYFIRMDSSNAFGTFTESYSMQTTLTAFSGIGETEPNNDVASATALTLGNMFRGAISSGDPLDYFSVNLNEGDGFTLDFSGAADSAPGARLLDSTGTELVLADDGQGISHVVDASGQFFIEVRANGNGVQGDYSGVVNRFAGASQHQGAGAEFEDATTWQFVDDQDTAIGRLDSLSDADVYRFEIDTFARYSFTLSPSGNDRLSDQSRLMTLYNDRGQFIAYSTSGSLHQERTDASEPGTYYIVVTPTAEAGTGSYGIRKRTEPFYSSQRDVPAHFVDFNQQQASYLGFNWVNSFAIPAAIPFVLGMFDARYSAYDIDVTSTLPTDDAEIVNHGYGDFGDIGAGGFGGGNRGQRSSRGNAITSARQTAWNNLSFGSTGTLIHEYGHAVGLPHARLPSAFMAYGSTDNVLPVGQGFSFRGTDLRRAGFSVRNERNFLDWSLQAGAQIIADDTTSVADALDLEPYFFEMQGELEQQHSVATQRNPNLIRAGDFNNDGDNDLVISNANTNTLQTFLGDGAGGFQLASTANVNEIAWWSEPMTVGDFNADGRSDVASISYNNSSVSILLGQANGTLGNQVNVALGARPQSITTTDLNGDNVLDLVAAVANDQVRVLLGTGGGNFAAPVAYAAGDNPYSVTAGDFNNDGFVDIATANANDDSATYLLGNGDGTLQTAMSLPAAEDPRSIVAGDFNEDGRDDLAIVSRAGRVATVYLANTSGFNSGVQYPAHDEGQTVTTGDVNRDGQLDLLVGGFDTDFRVLLGDAEGTFSRPVSIVGGDSEVAGVSADFAGDGFEDLVVVNYWSDEFALYTSLPNDTSNDIAVVYGEIDSADDLDFYSFEAVAGQAFHLDIDSAEFQYPLDASLRLLAADGSELARNQEALDLNSGLDSIDPFINYEFSEAGTYFVEVSGQWQTAGQYRLKVTPEQAFDQIPPRMIAAYPDQGASINATRELMFLFNDQLDPNTLLSSNVVVRGASSGVQSGSLRFDPLDSVLVWEAANDLPPDTYTVTLRGGAGGLADTHGNLFDGELAAGFQFPAISGDGTAGGDAQFSFTITSADTTPATLTSLSYQRHAYQRGRLQARFNDLISWRTVEEAVVTLRGAGPDGVMDTADDRLLPLDINQDKIGHISSRRVDFYTRGVPDPDLYRLEGQLQDAAGHTITLNEPINIGAIVSESGLFQDAGLSQPGLVGSYVNQSLRAVTAHDDWRTTQTISGTRTDYAIDFLSNSWGTRADVGITGGTDANWDDFSVQWDGWISIPKDGTRLQTRSDDGSRLWVDVNGDGTYESDDTEFWDNGWGTGHGIQDGALTRPLDAGTYQIRVQYEEGGGGNSMTLDWLTLDLAGEDQGYGHGPTVVGMNVRPGVAHEGSPIDRVTIEFSGAVDTSTLTTDNFQVWYSPDADFFDGNDSQLVDSDGVIAWDATTRSASLQPSAPLGVGYYRVFLNGEADGIYNTAGLPLDGEFLNSYIPGNTTAARWSFNTSGDGLPGGSYAATFSVAVVPLSLQLDPEVISEQNGQTSITLYRLDPNDVAQPLNIQITADQAGRLNFPSSVTIPAGQDSVTFSATAIDNDLLEGSVDVTLTASSIGYRDGTATLTILDHEELQLTATPDSIPEKDGVSQVRVSRAGSVGDVTVTLESLNLDKLVLPSDVVIPDGQSFVLVDATAVDNALVDGDFQVQVTANAAGMLGASTEIEVTDFEELVLAIESPSIEEGDVSNATVTRTDPFGDLIVQLTSLDTTEATVPGSILIPEGQLTSAPFQISAVSDGIGDGNQDVIIRANGTGYVDVDGQIQILDTEILTLVIEEAGISENGGQTSARVLRKVDGNALTVALSTVSSDVSLPATVVIPSGSLESDPFTISAVDNDVLDGTRTVSIEASAIDFFPGEASLVITDYEELVLNYVGANSLSEKQGVSSFVVRRVDPTGDLTVSLQNSDNTEISTAASIVIPDGSLTSDPITVTGEDDQLLDGTQQVTLTASATGYIEQQISFEVTDSEELNAAADVTEFPESGGQALVTLQRLNTNPDSEITVDIEYSDLTEIDGPTQIVFDPFIASQSFVINSVDDEELDGDQPVSLTFSSPGYENFTLDLVVLDHEALTLNLADEQISEFQGSTTVSLSRPQVANSDLIVQLTSTDTSEATVPQFATIEAGQRSTTFEVQAVDDDLLDGDKNVQIEAAFPGFVSANVNLLVQDHEVLLVTFDEDSISEQDGTTRATITRDGNVDEGITIALSTSPADELIVPSAVQILAGQTSTQFNVRSVYDPEVTGPKVIQLIASSPAYTESVGLLTVEDVDPIQVVLSEPAISEQGGSTELTITRGGNSLEEQVFNLGADLSGQLNLPAQVTIGANETFVALAVSALDNDLLDGTRTVEIEVSAPGYTSGTVGLSITDSEKLTVGFSAASVAEGVGEVEVSVGRSNTDTTQALTVFLAADEPSLVDFPDEVTIPAGQSSTTFSLIVIDDKVVEDDRSVRLTVNAGGYFDDQQVLLITDDDFYSWTNQVNRFDVNDDGFVSAIDALLNINELNRTGGQALPPPTTDPGIYYDVSEDEFLSSIDALMVINELNRGAGEGESHLSRGAFAAPDWYWDPAWNDEDERERNRQHAERVDNSFLNLFGK